MSNTNTDTVDSDTDRVDVQQIETGPELAEKTQTTIDLLDDTTDTLGRVGVIEWSPDNRDFFTEKRRQLLAHIRDNNTTVGNLVNNAVIGHTVSISDFNDLHHEGLIDYRNPDDSDSPEDLIPETTFDTLILGPLL